MAYSPAASAHRAVTVVAFQPDVPPTANARRLLRGLIFGGCVIDARRAIAHDYRWTAFARPRSRASSAMRIHKLAQARANDQRIHDCMSDCSQVVTSLLHRVAPAPRASAIGGRSCRGRHISHIILYGGKVLAGLKKNPIRERQKQLFEEKP